MIKRMRYRLILAAMLAFSSVVFLIALLVNVMNYLSVTGRLDETIEYISNYERGNRDMHDRSGRSDRTPKQGKQDMPSVPFRAFPDEESNYSNRFFIVRYDASGNFASAAMDHVASVDSQQAQQYGTQILNARTKKGYIGIYRYAKIQVNESTVVIFLNASKELRDVNALQILTLVVSIVSLILVFILVVVFSGRAIKPIEKNINRQKQFITDASHELKTPLTSIATSLDVITMVHGEDEWTENIKQQTGRMSKLVSELVTLSRLDEEHPLPNKEEFSVSNAAWEIVDIYTPQAKALNKQFETEISEDVSMYGDKASLQQMLSVLLDNAIRYSDENGKIRFSVTKKKNKVGIEVFNTCSFDTPPDTEKLFDRFYRPDGSRSTQTGGTGVGLAIARAVVEAHNGTITASCPDGSTMTIKVKL